MKRIIFYFSLFLSFFFLFTSNVNAATSVKSTEKYYQQNVIGTIDLYDDYSVKFTFTVEMSDVLLQVCPVNNCNNLTIQKYSPNQSYFGDEKTVYFYLYDHFELVDGQVYEITVQAEFLPTPSSVNGQPADLSHQLEYIEEKAGESNDDKNRYEEGIEKSTNKVVLAFRNIIIPLLYGVLVVVFIIKGILLALDLVKFADFPDIRKEKIRAFAYFGVAVFALVMLNTFAGWYTGLFG